MTRRSFSALLTVAAAALGASSQAQSLPAPPSPPGDRRIVLTAPEMLREAGAIAEQVAANRRQVSDHLDRAVQARDELGLGCLDECLREIDEVDQSLRAARGRLRGAIERRDEARRHHEFSLATIFRARADQLQAEARMCVGEETGVFDPNSWSGPLIVPMRCENGTPSLWATRGDDFFAMGPCEPDYVPMPTPPRTSAPAHASAPRPAVFIHFPLAEGSDRTCLAWEPQLVPLGPATPGLVRLALPAGALRPGLVVRVDGAPHLAMGDTPTAREEGVRREELTLDVRRLAPGSHEVSVRWRDARGRVCTRPVAIEGAAPHGPEVSGR